MSTKTASLIVLLGVIYANCYPHNVLNPSPEAPEGFEIQSDTSFSYGKVDGGVEYQPPAPEKETLQRDNTIGDINIADDNGFIEDRGDLGRRPPRPSFGYYGVGFKPIHQGHSQGPHPDPDDDGDESFSQRKGHGRFEHNPVIPGIGFAYGLGGYQQGDIGYIRPGPDNDHIVDDDGFSNGKGRGGFGHNTPIPGNGFAYGLGGNSGFGYDNL